MGRFWKLFGGKQPVGPLPPDRFESRVLEILKDRFGGSDFVPGTEELTVRFRGSVLGLRNLYALYTFEEPSEVDLVEMVVRHFEAVIATMAGKEGSAPPPWSEAAKIIRPQFLPAEYVREAPAPLATIPFNPHISIGLVLDREEAYSYVRDEDLELWSVAFGEAMTQALRNLNSASGNLKMKGSDGPDRFVACQALDGYDAVRILIPPLRAFLAERLGPVFYAGIPNRDFLICWAQDCTPAFHSSVREKVRSDNAEQPYPLTPSILIVSAEKVTAEDAS